jgi:hypothetical protein
MADKKLLEMTDDEIEAKINYWDEKLKKAFRPGMLKDEQRRRIERELDLREVALANQRTEE